MKTIALFTLIGLSCLLVTPSKAQTMKMKITVGDKQFNSTLNDGEAATELVKMLPLSVTMTEHNGNEKYYNLPRRMSGRAVSPGRVEAGDLMIWSSSTLVLFYEGARTSYSYIRLGRIDNPAGLREALGRGSVKVSFEPVRQ